MLDAEGPEIAVVTVALNAAGDLALTIESALAQTYPRLRLIVADGGSWDESDRVLARYQPYVDRLIVRADAGIYHAMNAILDEVSSDYVIFLNAGDQFWSAAAVARMVGEIDGRPDIFYGDHVYVDRRREHYRRSADFDWLMARLRRGDIDHGWHAAVPGHQATFTRTALLRELRFDTRLRIGADHEVLFRAHAGGGRLQYIDECVAHYHGGGFSALAGERTILEGVSIYRRFSEQPLKVDRLFFPSGSPFSPQTEMTGFPLGGFTRRTADPAAPQIDVENHWVSRDGATLIAPDRDSEAITLRGWNDLDGQRAILSVEGFFLAAVDVPRASFHLDVRFNRTVAPRRSVTVAPSVSAPGANGEHAGFALQSFEFHGRERAPRLLIERGTTVRFGTAAWSITRELMGSGWSAAEDTHTWSLGTYCDLWVPAAADARRIVIAISGNPHVDGGSRVSVQANGTEVDALVLDDGGRRRIEISCEGAGWQPGGINNVAMRLDASAVPPAGSGDLRDLGICLWSLEVE